MRLPKLGERGQAEAVVLQLTLIISLVVAIIVVYQLFLSGAGPTTYAWMDDNGENLGVTYHENERNVANPDYDADALAAYNNVITLSWAGIGLMAVAIIIIAASVILGVVRGFGGTRGV